MTRDGLLGLVVVTIFTLTSAVVLAAGTPKKTSAKPKPAPATSGVNQNRADAIGKSCEQWQKKREEACKKGAPEKKKLRDDLANAKMPAPQKKCEGETSGKEKKLCDDEKRFVMTDKQYGVEYQYTCDYEGKLGDRDRLSPAFRAEVATGETKNITGRGYCVADHRIRDLFKDKAKCAQAGDGKGYGTETKPESKDNCRGGVVQMAGDFDDKVVTELNTKVRCFEASTGQGEKAKKGEVGVISGYAGDAKRRVISFCRDDQKEVSDILKKKAEEGALAYDQEKKQFKLSEAGDDKKKQEEAKASLTKSPTGVTQSALDSGGPEKSEASKAEKSLQTKEQRAAFAQALEKKAADEHAAATGERKEELDRLRAASDTADRRRAVYTAENKSADLMKDDTYLQRVREEARANAAYNRALGAEFYDGWLRYYRARPQNAATQAYIEAYRGTTKTK